jgi:hypothetical protein
LGVSGNGVIRCYDFAGNEKWSLDVPANSGKFWPQPRLRLLAAAARSENDCRGAARHANRRSVSNLLALKRRDGKWLWPRSSATRTPCSSRPTRTRRRRCSSSAGKKQLVVFRRRLVYGHDVRYRRAESGDSSGCESARST